MSIAPGARPGRASYLSDRTSRSVRLGCEATCFELLEAWAQRAYTNRALVRALHLAGFDCGERIRGINRWTKDSR